jgi:hypothetical protein
MEERQVKGTRHRTLPLLKKERNIYKVKRKEKKTNT